MFTNPPAAVHTNPKPGSLRLTEAGNDVVLAQRGDEDLRGVDRDVHEPHGDRPEEGAERVVVSDVAADYGAVTIHLHRKDVLTEPADLDPAGRGDRKEERACFRPGLADDHAVLADEPRRALAARSTEIDRVAGSRPHERVTLAAARIGLADDDAAAVDVGWDREAAAEALDLRDPGCGSPDEPAHFGVAGGVRRADHDAVRADGDAVGDAAAERDHLEAAGGRPDERLLHLVAAERAGDDAVVADRKRDASGQAAVRVELRDGVASGSRCAVIGDDRDSQQGSTGNDGFQLHVGFSC